MSGFEVVGAVSAAIAFINTARTICEAAKDAGGLTTELKTISPQLALADGILTSVKARGNTLQDAAVDQAVMAALNICKERSKDLKEIFQKVGKTGDDNLLEQASKSFRAAKPGRISKVQKLMKDIMDTLHILHLHRMFEDEAAVQKLEAAREELSKLGPDESNCRVTVHGDGTNVDSEDIKQQIGDHNAMTNYSSGGGNMSFDQRGRQTVYNGNVYFESCTFSQICTDLRIPSDNRGLEQLLPQCEPSDTGEVVHRLRSRVPEPIGTVLASLATFSKSMSQSTKGEQAEQLIARLTVLFGVLQRDDLDIPVPDTISRQILHLKDRLKQTTCVKINEVRRRRGVTRLSVARSAVFSVIFKGFEMTLTTKNLESQYADGSFDTETCSTLHVQSLGVPGGSHISAYFKGRTDYDQTVWLHPVVLAYNEVNRHAKVFDLVRTDDLDGLKELLQIGEASLRDCDMEGQTLLVYACKHASVKTCRFLIDNGSDVDRYVSCEQSSLIGVSCKFGETAAAEEFELSLQCTRLLLQAGADPTSSVWIPDIDARTGDDIEIRPFPPLVSCLMHDTLELFDAIDSEGSAFINWHCKQDDDDNQQSLWSGLVLCLMFSDDAAYTIPVSTITALLDRGFGADFATPDMHGWNALPHLVLLAQEPDSGETLKAARILLPVVGNVLAEDCDGLTIFDRVQFKRPARSWFRGDESETYETSPKHHGSYQQDLLYCALFRSGHYAQDAIPPLPVGPMFTAEYTPQHYRALLYLLSWDMDADPAILDHPLLSQDPLLDEERERAPAFHEWNLSDLSMMERRLEHATFVGRVQECSSDNECSDTSASDESDDLDSNRSVQSEEEDSEEPEEGWLNVPVEEEEGLADSQNDWSDDSEEEGGVSVRL